MSGIICLAANAFANQTITQTIALKQGWNAIYFTVKPDQANPDILFEDTPVDQVLTFFPLHSPVQFIQDPDEVEWKKPGWHLWITKNRNESVLNNLFEIMANQAYIIFCTADHTLTVSGVPALPNFEWQPDSFNLAGFHVDPMAPPTFAQFFENSEAHCNYRIYTLNDNFWKRIDKPDTTAIVSGQAYWIYCMGGSNFQGPVELSLPGSNNNLDFMSAIFELNFEIRNQSSDPISFSLETINNTADAGFVPLSLVTYSDAMNRQYESFISYSPSNPIESGEKMTIRLAINHKAIVSDEVNCLLKLTDDLGDVFYIPVRAEKLIVE